MSCSCFSESKSLPSSLSPSLVPSPPPLSPPFAMGPDFPVPADWTAASRASADHGHHVPRAGVKRPGGRWRCLHRPRSDRFGPVHDRTALLYPPWICVRIVAHVRTTKAVSRSKTALARLAKERKGKDRGLRGAEGGLFGPPSSLCSARIIAIESSFPFFYSSNFDTVLTLANVVRQLGPPKRLLD